MTKDLNLDAVNGALSREVRKLQKELKAADKANTRFTARVKALEEELSKYTCTCEIGYCAMIDPEVGADEIDRLTAENERLRGALARIENEGDGTHAVDLARAALEGKQ